MKTRKLRVAAASEVAKNFGEWHDLALSQPVAITKYGRETVVMLSTSLYRSLLDASGADTVSSATTNAGLRMFTPQQILSGYSSGQIDWPTAAAKLGLQDYRQLAIAVADAGFDLPGTDNETIAGQARGATVFLRPFLKVAGDA